MPRPRHAMIDRNAPTNRILALVLFAGLVVSALFVTGQMNGTDVAPIAPSVAAKATSTPSRTPSDGASLPRSTATAFQARTSTATSHVITPTAELTTGPVAPTFTPTSYAPITRLLIPSIGVDAAVEVKSLDPDGLMQTPGAPDIAAWYDFSSQPVGEGNAVFAGHLDYAGYGPAVFWRLDELRVGDEIEVRLQDGAMLRYLVTGVRPFSATENAREIVSSSGQPTITLITCDGAFDSEGRTYDQRLVVTGDRID